MFEYYLEKDEHGQDVHVPWNPKSWDDSMLLLSGGMLARKDNVFYVLFHNQEPVAFTVERCSIQYPDGREDIELPVWVNWYNHGSTEGLAQFLGLDQEQGVVDVVASGYEWVCLLCEELNKIIAWEQTVECSSCQAVYRANEPVHVYD